MGRLVAVQSLHRPTVKQMLNMSTKEQVYWTPGAKSAAPKTNRPATRRVFQWVKQAAPILVVLLPPRSTKRLFESAHRSCLLPSQFLRRKPPAPPDPWPRRMACKTQWGREVPTRFQSNVFISELARGVLHCSLFSLSAWCVCVRACVRVCECARGCSVWIIHCCATTNHPR